MQIVSISGDGIYRIYLLRWTKLNFALSVTPVILILLAPSATYYSHMTLLSKAVITLLFFAWAFILKLCILTTEIADFSLYK